MIKLILLFTIRLLMRISNTLSLLFCFKKKFSYDALIIGNYDFIAPEQKKLIDELSKDNKITKFIITPENKTKLSKALAYIYTAFILPWTKNVILYDYCMPVYAVKKPSGQKHIQLWHANGAFKQIGIPNFYKKYSPELAKRLYSLVPIHSTYDYVFVSNENAIPYYMKGFGIEDRNKFLVANNVILEMIHERKLQFDATKAANNNANENSTVVNNKIRVICAPTFNYLPNENIYDDFKKAVLDEENSELNQAQIEFIELLHPKFATNFDKISVLLSSDYLVTDFSTVCFEAYAAGAKVLFLRSIDDSSDLDLFQDVARKVYTNPHSLAHDILCGNVIDNHLEDHLSDFSNSPTQIDLVLDILNNKK